MVSLDELMLKFSRKFSQESKYLGIWWFPRKDNQIRFLDTTTSQKNFVKSFMLMFPRNAFSKESLFSAIWKASPEKKS